MPVACIDAHIRSESDFEHIGVVMQYVRQFLEKGNSVVATARTPTNAKELQKLAEKDSKLTLTQVDVTSMESIKVTAPAAPQTFECNMLKAACFLAELTHVHALAHHVRPFVSLCRHGCRSLRVKSGK